MGNVKELAQQSAMERIDKICDKLINGIISRADAVKAINKVPNVELVIDRNNIDDHIDECLDKNKDVPQKPEDTNHCVVNDCTHDWGGSNDEDDNFIKESERTRD